MIIDILADQKEDNMSIKINKLLKNIKNEENFDAPTMGLIVKNILENIEEHEDQLGYTQKMRYEISKVTDFLLLGDEYLEPKSPGAIKFKEELKNVKNKIITKLTIF
jgi:hypothetical protein